MTARVSDVGSCKGGSNEEVQSHLTESLTLFASLKQFCAGVVKNDDGNDVKNAVQRTEFSCTTVYRKIPKNSRFRVCVMAHY